jgi:hypothetical protein
MPVKLFEPNVRVSAKADATVPGYLAAARVQHPIGLDLMARIKAKAETVPAQEPIDFGPTDVASAYGISPELAGQLIASLVRGLFLQPKVDGQFGFAAGYVLGPSAR